MEECTETPCRVTGTLDITDLEITNDDTAPLQITTEWTNDVTWACTEAELFATLYNDDYEASNALTLNGTGSYITNPTPYPELNYGAMPFQANSSVVVSGRWKGTDIDPVKIVTFNTHEMITKNCGYQVLNAPTLTTTIIEGDIIDDHNLTISSTATGMYD